MKKTTIPKRSDISVFNEKDTYFIYENILLVCESDKKSYGEEKFLHDAALKVNSSYPFDFVYMDYEVEMLTPKDNVFYFSAEASSKNSSRQYTKIVKKWYKHIRNAFAHNYISIENGAYVFEDYYEGKKVLYAKILSLEEFKSLINEVKINIK